MLRQFSAGVIVYYQDHAKREYLLLHYGSGHFDFPKGKIEKSETKHQAALRELHEETGLKTEIDSGFEHALHYYFKQNNTLIYKTVYFFTGKVHTKEVKLSHEHTGFMWLSYQEALEKLTYKNARETLIALEHYLNKK